MKPLPYRTHHLLSILRGFDAQRLPLDRFLMEYCRMHRALGAADRRVISDTVYTLTRWRGLLDHLIGGKPTWEQRVELLERIDPWTYAKDTSLPAWVRCSFPQPLFERIAQDYGEEEALRIGLLCNQTAPTTVRANTLKTTRDALLTRLQPQHQVVACTQSSLGITFLEKCAFRTLAEFKEGLFEVQDEGSQLVADLVATTPGEIVLDYCAGSGGKALAIAARMQNRGQLFLHDIRKHALLEARLRLRRAGVQNAQLCDDRSPNLRRLKKSCNWVLADVPCSGTGTLRRNPDMKWRFEMEWIDRLQGQQRLIFERALSFLKPGGCIVYATCSLLKAENEQQIEHFLKTYELELVTPPFKSLPLEGGMDGFFGAVMRRAGSGASS